MKLYLSFSLCSTQGGILLSPYTLAQSRRARLRRALTEATSDTVNYVKLVHTVKWAFSSSFCSSLSTPTLFCKHSESLIYLIYFYNTCFKFKTPSFFQFQMTNFHTFLTHNCLVPIFYYLLTSLGEKRMNILAVDLEVFLEFCYQQIWGDLKRVILHNIINILSLSHHV